MADFSSVLGNVNASVLKPSFFQMNMAYIDYVMDSAPCKAGVRNQCAVRMSVALGRCGSSLDAFEPKARVHRGRRGCQLTMPHVLGAEELAKYLKKIWGAPKLFSGAALKDAQASLKGKRGVVYFNNCFRREKNGPKVGDHIDLWTGEKYYNDIIHVGAGGNAKAGADLFIRTDKIWFFELS